jgi:uncharacterized protein (TIGR02246 family)
MQATASLSFLAPAVDGIVKEALTAFHAIPRRGAEMGGVLLGRHEEDRIVVEDFEPVVCEHRWGPSYILSETDLRGLEETLQWCARRDAGPAVVGFCRSHTRADGGPDDHDRELFERYFPDARAVFLLLKPDRQQQIEATYFARSGGILSQAAGPLPFPSEVPIDVCIPAVADAHTKQPELQAQPSEPAQPVPINGTEATRSEDPEPPARALWPPPPPRSIPPPTRPRLTAPSLTIADEAGPSQSRRWMWVVAVLCGGAGIFGFWSLDSGHKPATSSPAPAPAAASPQQTPSALPPSAPGTAAARAPEPPPASSLPAIQQMLTEWEQALRTGNPPTIAAFYAPRVDSYFGERNVSSAAVARSLARSAGRYGKTVVLRVTAVHIKPIGDDRASVTFRKRWQTSGKHTYTGETEERLTLAKVDDGWKIASEQETRVLWTQRSR